MRAGLIDILHALALLGQLVADCQQIARLWGQHARLTSVLERPLRQAGPRGGAARSRVLHSTRQRVCRQVHLRDGLGQGIVGVDRHFDLRDV